jgi:hypothetical protein
MRRLRAAPRSCLAAPPRGRRWTAGYAGRRRLSRASFALEAPGCDAVAKLLCRARCPIRPAIGEDAQRRAAAAAAATQQFSHPPWDMARDVSCIAGASGRKIASADNTPKTRNREWDVMNMFRRYLAFLCVVVPFVSFVSVAHAETIVVGAASNLGGFAVLVAQEKGFFAKNGIDAKIEIRNTGS